MKDKLLSPNEASRLLGGKVSANCLRQQVYNGTLDLGAVKVPRADGKTRLYFPESKILEWIGREDELKKEHQTSEQEQVIDEPLAFKGQSFSEWYKQNKLVADDLTYLVKGMLAEQKMTVAVAKDFLEYMKSVIEESSRVS